VRAALADHHLRVAGDLSIDEQRTVYDRSAAAWSLALGVVAGVVALLIALLVMVVIAVTTWRGRTRDLAALRMAGLGTRRIRGVAVAGQLLAVVVAVVAGALTGLLGAQLALDGIPMFTRAPEVGTLDLATSWPAVLVAGAAALVLLAVAGLAIGRRLAGSALLTRLREAA
jgi:ABC-type antimicrobial peptide transport system permease subunit